MGIDKSNIRTIIHYNLSPSVEAYLQESGRAGRDRKHAEAVLLLSPSDLNEEGPALKSDAASDRYRALLQFATDSTACRRESLMDLLGAQPDTCFGCDVCRKSVIRTAPWQQGILKLLKRNKRMLTSASASKLITERYKEISLTDASVIIDELLISGNIRKIQKGPWKGKLTAL